MSLCEHLAIVRLLRVPNSSTTDIDGTEVWCRAGQRHSARSMALEEAEAGG